MQKDLVDVLQRAASEGGLTGIIISVSKVSVTVDLSIAKVYLSIFPNKEAKELYDLTKAEHTATLVYAINEQGSHANMNHLSDFNTKDTHVKSKKR